MRQYQELIDYSNFTLAQARATFNLTLDESQNLFADIEGVNPSDLLSLTLNEYIPLATAIGTEKARSELLIAPILTEVRRQVQFQISLFSGTEFNVDAAKGLQGFCDFLISASPEQYFITAPIVTIVEAKNENIIADLCQCVAEMVAAQVFNQQVSQEVEAIYGIVTSGTVWKFLRLSGSTVFINSNEYYIKKVDKILAIILQPIRSYLVRTNI